MATMKTAIETSAKALARSQSDTEPLRRSQHIRSLEARGNEQSEMILRETRQEYAKSRRKPKGWALKDWNLSTYGMPQRITQPRELRKRNPSTQLTPPLVIGNRAVLENQHLKRRGRRS
ncbi:hypothetical protein AJ78_07139 [Emergomyces pasteurianus Ep9510]|uniref:Uncharacterized protein n=1 Tax=Emergomyces pasteurianus Ep9510 TaxID=1447872 RepID=A0A1J9P6D9_9EURO|nr:hypothetical protein AJ78_07139 [Emergomyces pasteurianus Ep9510]